MSLVRQQMDKEREGGIGKPASSSGTLPVLGIAAARPVGYLQCLCKCLSFGIVPLCWGIVYIMLHLLGWAIFWLLCLLLIVNCRFGDACLVLRCPQSRRSQMCVVCVCVLLSMPGLCNMASVTGCITSVKYCLACVCVWGMLMLLLPA